MKNSERLKLLSELSDIQSEYPVVDVTIDWDVELGRNAQNRVDEIERMLIADQVSRIPPADLEE